MHKTVGYILTFVLGVSCGHLIAVKTLEHKYEKEYQDDVRAVKKMYAKKAAKESPADEEPDTCTDKAEEIIEQNAYISEEEEDTVMYDDVMGPIVIDPNEFGDDPDYDRVTYYYYADGVVADEYDNRITNYVSMIGDALKHFGEYSDDAVHVRNDKIKTYFEILRSAQKFQ